MRSQLRRNTNTPHGARPPSRRRRYRSNRRVLHSSKVDGKTRPPTRGGLVPLPARTEPAVSDRECPLDDTARRMATKEKVPLLGPTTASNEETRRRRKSRRDAHRYRARRGNVQMAIWHAVGSVKRASEPRR